jgi:hypothetical protein
MTHERIAIRFEYSWEDLQAIRPLMVTSLVVQLLGAALGLWLAALPSRFMNIWTGGALATFPGFLMGMAIQVYLRPGSIGENHVMVRRRGFIALLLSLSVFELPLDKFGENGSSPGE